MPPSSRHSAHPSHHPHAGGRDLHHGAGGPPPQGGPGMPPGPGNGPMHHPHSSYAQSMPPPPGLPPHAMNGVNGPPSGHGGPPPRMVMADGPGGAGGPPPPPPPHIPRSSSAQSRIMDAGAGPAGPPASSSPAVQKLSHANETAWVSVGSAAETMEDYDRALSAYEAALRHNPYSVPALGAIAGVHRTLDNFEKAVDYFQRVLNIVPENGDTWGSMGHCYLMMDDLQRAYTAYQQALYHLPNPKEPKLWYGIGILYDRYGSLEHAEEAFASVVRMDPNYEKANEIYFRLGIIYKQQNKFPASLECFRYILDNPPRPLTEIDIWFQIGHVYEQQKEFNAAKEAYERVLAENPNHAKVLQQLGWLYHLSNAGFNNQERAIQFLTKSLESDPNDAQSWYLLGRAYMAGQNYNKAYEAYQQAVYRDGKNPTFWCSIGVLYYQINQYRDALDAYSRAIRLNPYISEVWFDLGSLYEACNNQISDAIHAYERAADLDPDNPQIQQRLQLLRNAEAKGGELPEAPVPQDVHPTAYANNNGMAPGPPTQIGGGPGPSYPPPLGGPQLAGTGGGRGDLSERDLPGPGHLAQSHSPPPFRGAGPPGPDERGSRGPPPGALAPMVGGPGGPEPLGRGGFPHSRGPSPGPPRMDPYGRRLASPPRRSPPPPLRSDMHDGHGPHPHAAHGHGDFRGPPPLAAGGPGGPPPPMDHYGRPMGGGPMSERDRELEWEREREREREQAARGYPSGRITPKNEPGYARSQHGSNAPSPAFGRPPVYGRDEARDYYNNGHPNAGPGGPRGGYERGPPPGMRHDERGPPPPHFEHERGHLPPPPPPPQQQQQAGDGRYDGYGEGHDGLMSGAAARPPPPGLRGPTPDWERARGGDHGPPSIHDGSEGRNAGGPAGKPRRGPKSKDEFESAPAPPSPAPSAAGKKGKATGSRASSPWSAKAGAAGKNGKNGPAATGGKKGVSTPLRSRDDQAGSRPGSPMGGARAQRDASPASSDGSNEPLAARGPSSRMVDEDYDEGAADALMGLAGAASASVSATPVAPASDRAHSPDKRAESSLGKRPFTADEEKGVNGPEDSYKRAKSGSASATAADVEASNGASHGASAPVKPESAIEREGSHASNGKEAAPQAATPPPKAASPKSNSGGAERTTQPMDVDAREPSKGPSSEAGATTKDSPSTADAPTSAAASTGTRTTPAPAAPASTTTAAPASTQSQAANNTTASSNNNNDINNNEDDDSREEEEGQIHEDDNEASAKSGDETKK
ncbi:probable TPR-containing protein Mql1 [Ustilago trichophora]|uniref:Probable TPR-containing protein Mql1 n=1 Tax=Ustilago trichophora TaxID=86804 RepID=A0A5C3EP24_9BASI|nr:probable TPR-containing protein Mql1 [Ustilago trichophora]